MGGLWRRRLAASVTLAVIVTGTMAVEAQELRDRDRTLSASRQIADDLRRARIHYGPFYLLSSIQLADIGYDQDYFMPVADTRSGFRFGLSAPQRLYFTPNRKTFLSAAFTPQWSRFGGLSARNQTGYLGRADAQFLLNHLYLDLYATKSDALHADVGELSSLVTRKNTEVGATGELKYSSRTSMTYSAVTRSQKFPLSANKVQPDFPVELLDRNEHSYRTALVHKTFPLTSLLLAAEYAGYAFPNATFKDSHRRYGGAGLGLTFDVVIERLALQRRRVHHQLLAAGRVVADRDPRPRPQRRYGGAGFLYESGRTTSRFEAGYAQLNFERSDQRDFKGGVGNLNINHRISERWILNGSASRDLAFSIFKNNNYYVENRATLNTQYSLTRRLALTAGWTGAEDTYDVPTAGSKLGTVARRRDRMSFPSIGWIYTSPNHFTGGFDVGYFERSSNFPIAETDGIRLVLHLSLSL